MDIKKNLKCCAVSPVCHFVALIFGVLAMIQLAHTHAHYTMETDVDSYVHNFCRKNAEKCKSFASEY